MWYPASPSWGLLVVLGEWSLATLGEGSQVRFTATSGWGLLPVVVVGPSPLLAEDPGCGSPPLLAGVRCRWWWVVLLHSWLRVRGAFPRHSWLGSAGGGCVWPFGSPG